jgi:hypothetical protein
VINRRQENGMDLDLGDLFSLEDDESVESTERSGGFRISGGKRRERSAVAVVEDEETFIAEDDEFGEEEETEEEPDEYDDDFEEESDDEDDFMPIEDEDDFDEDGFEEDEDGEDEFEEDELEEDEDGEDEFGEGEDEFEDDEFEEDEDEFEEDEFGEGEDEFEEDEFEEDEFGEGEDEFEEDEFEEDEDEFEEDEFEEGEDEFEEDEFGEDEEEFREDNEFEEDEYDFGGEDEFIEMGEDGEPDEGFDVEQEEEYASAEDIFADFGGDDSEDDAVNGEDREGFDFGEDEIEKGQIFEDDDWFGAEEDVPEVNIEEESKVKRVQKTGIDFDLPKSVGDKDFIDQDGEINITKGSDISNTFTLDYIAVGSISIPASRIRAASKSDTIYKDISRQGLLVPITVAPLAADGRYVLVDGYRRYLNCARLYGKDFKIPCVINSNIRTTDLNIVEAMLNRRKKYSMKEIIDFIEYLEKQKGLYNSNTIEYLTQLDPGDYSKLKDIINDNDDEIAGKLLEGAISLEEAFKKLEKRRKKETPEEKEERLSQKVMGDKDSALSEVGEKGNREEGEGLTDEQLEELMMNTKNLDESVEGTSLDDLVKDSNNIEGYQPHKQTTDNREYIDPATKKARLAIDNNTCQACLMIGGASSISVLDYHHRVPVELGGDDDVSNGITLCLCCHNMVHNFANGGLVVEPEKTREVIEKMEETDRVLYELNVKKMKRIVKLGDLIRRGRALKGISKEQAKKNSPATKIGRRFGGSEQTSDY